ncbi:hypothetical protein EDF46_1943 [Frondihabitans sp. PhB188]|uniref:hypothetical protein n=1 Tax=Frondihabitans sp. PhB188 TaxID=2485200 RepID=UPI000F4742AF|nr:hypothetical protein [Frondihabitans sp. PhB188]ROQ38312.1 hypothetical protein EDF46_1943 [Frondihabitans sp. PhB188]
MPRRNVALRLLDSLVLAVVAPTGLPDYLRVLGLALIAEGLFLLAISGTAPVGQLAWSSLLTGEILFVASFAPLGG